MNIADIARMAGVSNAAVSRYFNNGYISEEKREAIRRVVEDTGYRPSSQAQMLRTKKTRMIGVIAPKMASFAMGNVVDGILAVLKENEYHMMLAVTQNDPAQEVEYLQAFNEKQVDGVILIGTVFTDAHLFYLEKMSVPVVILGQKLDGYCCVYHDDYHAMYDLTTELIRRGRKNLAYIGIMREDQAVGTFRNDGFSAALQDHGLGEQADRSVIGEFSMQSGYEKARELMERYENLDAIVCATDEIAVGALEYLYEQGLRIPEQIMVTGHGDSTLMRVSRSGMLTVHYSFEKSGEIAANMLMQRISGGDSSLKEIKLGYYLVG